MAAALPESLSTQEIIRHLNTDALRTQLLAQISKDLMVSTSGLDVSLDSFFADLTQLIQQRLVYVIENQNTLFAQIIYQVDVNEARITRLLRQKDINSTQLLANEILRREMIKIYYRNTYRAGG